MSVNYNQVSEHELAAAKTTVSDRSLSPCIDWMRERSLSVTSHVDKVVGPHLSDSPAFSHTYTVSTLCRNGDKV